MSKFIAFAFPVPDAATARSRIAEIAREYHDARHVCWAYSIGADSSEEASNDNGEPSGTAGKPILGQIHSHSLCYTAIAVVRYFGGIKLGTPGLIAAYRAAAAAAIEAGEIVAETEKESVTAIFPYLAMNEVMKVVKNPEITVTQQIFDNTCTITMKTRADRIDALKLRLADIDGVSIIEK